MTHLEELLTARVSFARQSSEVLDDLITYLHKTDEKLDHNEVLRDLEMQNLRWSFNRITLAEKISKLPEYRDWNLERLHHEADCILGKRGHVKKYPPSEDMRTADEERMYGSLRANWSNLLKKAKIRAADNRGGPRR